MAVRRGVWLVIVLIMLAVIASVAGLLLLYTAVGREPQVAGNSTLVLRVGGDLEEMEPGGVIGQFIEAPPTVRSTVELLRKARIDRRITSVILKPTGTAALWGWRRMGWLRAGSRSTSMRRTPEKRPKSILCVLLLGSLSPPPSPLLR